MYGRRSFLERLKNNQSNHMRKLIPVVVLLTLLLGAPVSAQSDQRCWTESDCEGVRRDAGLTGGREKGGFVTNSETRRVCGKEGDKE